MRQICAARTGQRVTDIAVIEFASGEPAENVAFEENDRASIGQKTARRISTDKTAQTSGALTRRLLAAFANPS
jgi:hypothetical protein